MENKKRNFDYLRLSREDGDVISGTSSESQSITSQRACIQQYRESHPDLPTNFEEIVDDGYSGTNFNRPGIQEILRLVELEQVDTIIVRDLSRFARNYLDAGNYLEYVFPAHGVRFIAINDGYDSAAYDQATAGLHVAIKNLINQMYSHDLSQKIKSAVDIKKANGEYIYGAVAYGYKKGKVKNTIVVDAPAAQVVRRIFLLACEGNTITEICRILNKEGVETPSVYLSSVRGNYPVRNSWSYESVRNILGNRIYTGDTVTHKSHVVEVGCNRVKLLAENEQTVLLDTHEAIIQRELFFDAKKVVKSNKKSPSKGSTSVLTSYLVCGCCGNRLIKGKAKNKDFLCASARYVPDSDCSKIRCNEEKMKKVLLHAIRKQCQLMDAHIKMSKSAAKSQESESDAMFSNLRRQKRLLEQARSSKMDLYEKYISGKYSKDEYMTQKSLVTEQEESAKIQITLLENRLAESSVQGMHGASNEPQREMISKYQNISELDSVLMKELVKKVIVYPDDKINIIWNFKDIVSLLRDE